jgi:hypothetical protein
MFGDRLRATWRRPLVREVLLLAAVALFMAGVGAFSTDHPSILRRIVYWLTVMMAGGLVGVAVEVPLTRRMGVAWRRAVAVTLLMSLPVTVIVWVASWVVWGAPLVWWRLLGLWPAVLLVCTALNAIRYGVRERSAPTAGEGEAPLDAAFRRRLSARTRHAPLYAVEGVSWRRGRGELRLAGGLTAPVSRTYAPILREHGWF